MSQFFLFVFENSLKRSVTGHRRRPRNVIFVVSLQPENVIIGLQMCASAYSTMQQGVTNRFL